MIENLSLGRWRRDRRLPLICRGCRQLSFPQLRFWLLLLGCEYYFWLNQRCLGREQAWFGWLWGGCVGNPQPLTFEVTPLRRPPKNFPYFGAQIVASIVQQRTNLMTEVVI